MTMICPDCGREYEPALKTHTRCRVCYFEKRGDLDMALAELAWSEGFTTGYQRGQAAAISGDTAALVSLQLVEDAVKLCHPDRHPPERFERANTVTVGLLNVRDAMRASR